MFENERYDPLRGRWVPPFILGDFCASSDLRGAQRFKNDVKLTSGWEWQGQIQ